MTRVIHKTVIAAEPCVRPKSLSAALFCLCALNRQLYYFLLPRIDRDSHRIDMTLRNTLIIILNLAKNLSREYYQLKK